MTDFPIIFYIVGSMLASLMAVRWVYFKVLKIAKDKNLVDNPDARKLQKSPVPVVGGLAVFFGMVLGLLLGISLYGFWTDSIQDVAASILPIIMAMVLMLYAGTIDDILGLTPLARFAIEILVILGIIYSTGTCIDSLHGLWGIGHFSWYVAVPLTVFAGVGIINAINMVDGVNGLSPGLCTVCALMFGGIFLSAGDIANAMLAFTMAASLLPFLVHNVFGNSSRMFIGDAGTMVMGIQMTWFVICAMRTGSALDASADSYCITALVVAILSVPVADTLRVMAMRLLRGKSPFSPDRTHLHHAFVSVGISHSITALSEITINILVVAIWFVAATCGTPLHCQLYLVVLTAATLVWGTYFFLEHEHSTQGTKAQWLRVFSPKTHFGSKEWWQRISFFLDSPEYSERERKNLRERLDRKFMNH